MRASLSLVHSLERYLRRVFIDVLLSTPPVAGVDLHRERNGDGVDVDVLRYGFHYLDDDWYDLVDDVLWYTDVDGVMDVWIDFRLDSHLPERVDDSDVS